MDLSSLRSTYQTDKQYTVQINSSGEVWSLECDFMIKYFSTQSFSNMYRLSINAINFAIFRKNLDKDQLKTTFTISIETKER